MTVIDAVDRFRAVADRTRALVVARVTDSFTRLGRVDDDAVDEFLGSIIPLIEAGQIRVSSLTDAYLSSVISEVYGTAPAPRGITPVTYSTFRNGIPAALVYTRPFITARTNLHAGMSIEDAIRIAASRLDATVHADLQLAERHTAMRIIKADDRITGFRRVIRPAASKSGSCGLCLAASSQRYGKEDLLPIHNRCHCAVMPIFRRGDPALSINKERYSQAAQLARPEGQRRGATRSQLSHVRIREHGELGPVLTKSGDRFTGPEAISG